MEEKRRVGRPSKEETKVLSYRVRVKKAEGLDVKIKRLILDEGEE